MKKIALMVLMCMATVATASALTVDRNARKVKDNSTSLRTVSDIRPTAAEDTEIEYVDLGTGLMTDAMLTEWYQLQPVTYDVKIQQAKDGSAHYRVIAPYGQAFADAMDFVNGIKLKDTEYDKDGTYYLDIDATNPDNVYFPKTYIGADWGDGQMYIGIPTIGTVTLKDGIFTANPRGVAVGDDTGAVAMNMSGKFRIVLPGITPTDYILEIKPDSHCISDSIFNGELTVGNDIAKVYYGILTNFQEDEILTAYGAVASAQNEFKLRGKFKYEMNDNARKETVVFVGVDKDGAQVAQTWTSYYRVEDNPDQWVTIGTGQFTDPFLPALLSCDSETLTVEIQAHKTRTGYLRLKNPYHTSKYATPTYYHGNPENGHNHYIYINGEDPEIIYIEESPICFDFGHGQCRVNSATQYFVDAGFDIEECKELELGAVYENGVLTFPDETSLNFSMLGYDNGDWYYTDPEKGDFRLTLPEGYDFAGVSTVTTDTDLTAPVRYYNLQGIEVTEPVNGVFIRVQGKTSTKIAL